VRLEQERRKRRVSFKEVVNDVLRTGLNRLGQPEPRPEFRTKGFTLGPSLVGSLDNVEDVLARRRRRPPVIPVDANPLVYAANQSAPEHGHARSWRDARLHGTARIGLPWPSLLAFVRIVSNPAILRRPVPPADAWHQVTDWLGCDAAWIPLPGKRHPEVLGGLLEGSLVTSRLVPDAHRRRWRSNTG
jgi:hypothetical protein